ANHGVRSFGVSDQSKREKKRRRELQGTIHAVAFLSPDLASCSATVQLGYGAAGGVPVAVLTADSGSDRHRPMRAHVEPQKLLIGWGLSLVVVLVPLTIHEPASVWVSMRNFQARSMAA